MTVYLKHGSARIRAFPDFAAASAFYCAKRDKSGNGASRFPFGLLYAADGQLLGHISYNGRVWRGLPQTWTTSDLPLYDNR